MCFFKNVSTCQYARGKATGGSTDPVTANSKKGKADSQSVGPKMQQFVEISRLCNVMLFNSSTKWQGLRWNAVFMLDEA